MAHYYTNYFWITLNRFGKNETSCLKPSRFKARPERSLKRLIETERHENSFQSSLFIAKISGWKICENLFNSSELRSFFHKELSPISKANAKRLSSFPKTELIGGFIQNDAFLDADRKIWFDGMFKDKWLGVTVCTRFKIVRLAFINVYLL